MEHFLHYIKQLFAQKPQPKMELDGNSEYRKFQRQYWTNNFPGWFPDGYKRNWSQENRQSLIDYYTCRGQLDEVERVKRMFVEVDQICRDLDSILEREGITHELIKENARKDRNGTLEEWKEATLWYYGILQKMVALGYGSHRLTA